jgi:hypothetical protein
MTMISAVTATSAITRSACVKNVATCRGAVVTGATYARVCGWIAGMNSTTAKLEAEGDQLSGLVAIGVPGCRSCTTRCMLLG